MDKAKRMPCLDCGAGRAQSRCMVAPRRNKMSDADR